MRHLRAKQGRKTLNFFRISFGITPPYSVLLDGNFIHVSVSFKIDIYARMKKHLGSEQFRFFVPSRVIDELVALGPSVEASLEFARIHCEVVTGDGSGTTPTDEIISLVGETNRSKYLVATQEDTLRDHLRNVPGVPLFHIQRTVLLLEAPSSSSKHISAHQEAKKLKGFSSTEMETFKNARKVKMQERAEKRRNDGVAGGPKKQIAKGPNPLSCLKKKKERFVFAT